jgi:hypothetical protein
LTSLKTKDFNDTTAQIDLYKQTTIFLDKFSKSEFLTNNKEVIQIRKIKNKILPFICQKKDEVYSKISSKFMETCDKLINISNEKTVVINTSKNEMSDEENINIYKTILNFPDLFQQFLQRFYDNFLVNLHNKNCILVKEVKEDRLEFRQELFKENSRINEILENFNIFIELITEISKRLLILSNIIQQKNYLEQSENCAITYDYFYGGSNKKSKNNFIFVLSYNISNFYKTNFKDKISQLREEEFKENMMKVEKLWNEYRETINKDFCRVFESIQNFKFFDLEDFKFDYDSNPFISQFLLFRTLIVKSYQDAANLKIRETTVLELLNEILKLNFNEEEIALAEEYDKPFLGFCSQIVISNSFWTFLCNFFHEFVFKQEVVVENSTEELGKIFSLLLTLYNSYFEVNEFSSSSFTEVLLMHNNIEALTICLNYYLLLILPTNQESESQLNTLISNSIIILKNFSGGLMSQINANFIREMIGELSLIESFEEIRFERNSKNVSKMLDSLNEIIFKFYNSFKDFANEKDVIFNINTTLSFYFDSLNRKIIGVKDFDTQDLTTMDFCFKNLSSTLKKNLEKLFETSKFKLRLTEMLEANIKYKKFEEILFVLKHNLKEIRTFIIESNYNIHIDGLELIDLITNIFSPSQNRANLIELINDKILKN